MSAVAATAATLSETLACPLCTGAATRLHRLPHTTAWRCGAATCGLRFAAPQLEEHELAQRYRSLYYPEAGASAPGCEETPEAILRSVVGTLRERLLEGAEARLLDFGCGRGALLRLAAEAGFAAVGIEPDAKARAAATVASASPVHESLLALRQRDPEACFDAITLWQVVEHLREPWRELAQLRALLKPGGCLVLATPNAAGLKARLLGARWENVVNPTHFYYFTPASLRRALAAAGFAAPRRLRVASAYPHHGPLRRMVQSGLRSAGLDGDLLVLARGGASR